MSELHTAQQRVALAWLVLAVVPAACAPQPRSAAIVAPPLQAFVGIPPQTVTLPLHPGKPLEPGDLWIGLEGVGLPFVSTALPIVTTSAGLSIASPLEGPGLPPGILASHGVISRDMPYARSGFFGGDPCADGRSPSGGAMVHDIGTAVTVRLWTRDPALRSDLAGLGRQGLDAPEEASVLLEVWTDPLARCRSSGEPGPSFSVVQVGSLLGASASSSCPRTVLHPEPDGTFQVGPVRVAIAVRCVPAEQRL